MTTPASARQLYGKLFYFTLLFSIIGSSIIIGIIGLDERDAHAQVLPRGAAAKPIPVNPTEAAVEGFVETINLPAGEKFVAFVPVTFMRVTSRNYLGHVGKFVLTEKRPVGEKPRRLTAYNTDPVRESPPVMFFIQEH